MGKNISRRLLMIGLAALLFGVVGVAAAGAPDGDADPLATTAEAADMLNCNEPPELKPDLPGAPRTVPDDMTAQNEFNCFAWQEFIALSWQADPAMEGQPDLSQTPATFGEPQTFQPLVWETYKEAYEVFLPDAREPSPWNAEQQLPEPCVNLPELIEGEDHRIIQDTFKFSDQNQLQVLDEFGQADASGSDPDAWLTAQSGDLAHYEVRMNEVEFAYIVENEFYNAVKQYEAVQDALANGGPGIYFPKGTPDKAGAIEIKGAWLEIKDPARWNEYLLSEAYVYDEQAADQTCRKAVMGLIGLHIIQKSTDQWVWATFEHINNAPSIEDIRGLDFEPYYNFYNHNCRENCLPNKKPDKGQPMDLPVQVVRVKNIQDAYTDGVLTDNIASLNGYAREIIREANPDSVFQNYMLVDTGWPVKEVANDHVTTDPLPYKDMVPQRLSNSVMETYFQNINCTSCHSVAHIAPSSKDENPQWRSDYSFLLSRAKEPGE